MTRHRLTKKNISLIVTGILIIIGFLNQAFPNNYLSNLFPSPTSTPTSSSQIVKVTRVIDGDTVEIETGQKVRYIGVDTPELHDPKKPIQCYAEEAMETNKQIVEGKSVKLEKDISNTDKYGRLLRYVYLINDSSPSGLFINQYLVEKGFAYAATFPPDVKYADILAISQKIAMENKVGLWKTCPIKK